MRRALLLTLLFCAAPTAASAATFTDPFPLSAAYQGGQAPVAAMAPTGDAIVAFDVSDSPLRSPFERAANNPVQVALRAAGHGFTFGLPIEDRYGVNPVVAMDAIGNARVAWLSTDNGKSIVREATARPGAGFGTPVTISDATHSAGNPAIAMDDAGDATIAWSYTDTHAIAYADAPAGGTFGTPQALVSPADPTGDVRVIDDATGDTVIAYDQQTSSTTSVVSFWRRLQPVGTWTQRLISAVNSDYLFPAIAMNADGAVDVAYQTRTGTCPGCTKQTVVRRYSNVLALAYTDSLGSASQTTVQPEIIDSKTGNAAVLWADGADVKLATAPPGADFTELTDPIADNVGPTDVSLAGTPDGDLLAAWAQTSLVSIGYALRTGTTGTLTTGTVAGGTTYVSAAMSSPTDAVMTWLDFSGPKAFIKAAATQPSAIPTPDPTPTATVTATATATATATVSPTPTPSPKFTAKLKRAGTYKRSAKSLKFRCTLNRPGTCTVTVKAGKRRVGRAKVTFAKAATKTIKVKLKKLRHARKITVGAMATAGTAKATAKTLKIRLKK